MEKLKDIDKTRVVVTFSVNAGSKRGISLIGFHQKGDITSRPRVLRSTRSLKSDCSMFIMFQ